MRELYRLTSSELEVEPRPGYLHLILSGCLRAQGAAEEAHSVMEAVIARFVSRRALLDLRESRGLSLDDDRGPTWSWLRSGHGFDQLACVTREGGELDATRIDMTALALGLGVRCFANVTDAHRWLSLRSRVSTQTMPAVRVEPGGAPPSSGRSQTMRAMSTTPPASSRSQSFAAVRPEEPEPPSRSSTPPPAWASAPDPLRRTR